MFSDQTKNSICKLRSSSPPLTKRIKYIGTDDKIIDKKIIWALKWIEDDENIIGTDQKS